MKKWIALIVVLAVAAGGYFLWTRGNAGGQPQEDAAGAPMTASIASRTITLEVNAAGDIGPDDQVSVRPEVNGRISELPVDIGDQVKKGDLLCALDDKDLQTERSSRQTDIEGAQLQLDQAKRDFLRNKQLYADNLVPKETFETADTTYQLAQNALERAQKALSQVEDQLSKTRIVAPFDCTVLTRPVSVGQAVSGSGGVGGGTEIMTIANLKQMVIKAHLNQADVVQVNMGQKVDVRVEAVPGLEMTGVVDRIAPQATIKNNIKGFETEILLTDIDPRVRPGMTANMTIPVLSKPDVPAIPLAAVFTEDGDRYAYVRQGEDRFERRPIEIGVSDYQYAQISSGLKLGDIVSLVRPPMAEIVKSQSPPDDMGGKTASSEKTTEIAASETPASPATGSTTNRPATVTR